MRDHHKLRREYIRTNKHSERQRDALDTLRIEGARLRNALLAPKAEAALLDAARMRSIRLHLERDAKAIETDRHIQAISEAVRDRVMPGR